jgi:hypothetical protein
MAAVICLQPSLSDNIIQDTTTALTVNNIARLEVYGGVMILNLFSILTNKLCFRYNSDEDLTHKENDACILKAAAECDTVILAWGKGGNNNERIANRAERVMQLLEPYKDKLYVISDGERSFLHPLTPRIRSSWQLVKYDSDADESSGGAPTKKSVNKKTPEATHEEDDEETDDDTDLS